MHFCTCGTWGVDNSEGEGDTVLGQFECVWRDCDCGCGALCSRGHGLVKVGGVLQEQCVDQRGLAEPALAYE